METTLPQDLRTAYEDCLRLANSHYENFPVASLLMPKAQRLPIASLYAFARIADDFADENGPGRTSSVRLKDLHNWERDFQNAVKGRPAPPVLGAFAHTVRLFKIPLRLPLALLKAFRMDVTVHRYATWDRLLYYSRHSAEPVGRMVLLISGIRDEKLHRFSDRICSGLQLINFWQDSSEDLAHGRIYYPRSEWKKAGVTEKDLLARRDSDATRALVRQAVGFTEKHFAEGLPLLSSVQGRLRLELTATYLGGQGVLDKIRAMGYNVMDRHPAWNALEKASLLLRALCGRTPKGIS